VQCGHRPFVRTRTRNAVTTTCGAPPARIGYRQKQKAPSVSRPKGLRSKFDLFEHLRSRKTSRGAIKPFADTELIFSQHGHGEAEVRRIDLQCQHFSYDTCKSRYGYMRLYVDASITTCFTYVRVSRKGMASMNSSIGLPGAARRHWRTRPWPAL